MGDPQQSSVKKECLGWRGMWSLQHKLELPILVPVTVTLTLVVRMNTFMTEQDARLVPGSPSLVSDWAQKQVQLVALRAHSSHRVRADPTCVQLQACPGSYRLDCVSKPGASLGTQTHLGEAGRRLNLEPGRFELRSWSLDFLDSLYFPKRWNEWQCLLVGGVAGHVPEQLLSDKVPFRPAWPVLCAPTSCVPLEYQQV